MMILWVAVIVAVVALVIWLVRQAQVGSGHAHTVQTGGAPGETALEILKVRYAKGEIEKAEYEEKKKDLGG
ncbi:MAG: SHOCT domain-containing protein [Thermoleophilia bacterium]